MKVPNVIYLQTCGDCGGLDCAQCEFESLDEVTWCKDKVYDSDTTYYSEDNVREVLLQVVKDANSLISQARQSAVITLKLDAEKYIPHIIQKLKGAQE